MIQSVHSDCATSEAGWSLHWLAILSSLPFRGIPIALTTTMIATDIPAATRRCLMAVAPVSSLRNATNLDTHDNPSRAEAGKIVASASKKASQQNQTNKRRATPPWEV